MVTFSTTSLESYGIGQDISSRFEVRDAGATLALQGNTWQRLAFDYSITPDTILEFDFQVTALGEIHGIGFDRDNSHSAGELLQLTGTQSWGLGNVRSNLPLGQWRSYRIAVGEFFSGPMRYLTFVNDHDVRNPTAASLFRNVRVYEEPQSQPLVDGSTQPIIDFAQARITAYGDQDQTPQNTVIEAGAGYQLSGNSWKKLDLNYNITADTVVTFEFWSDRRGEIQAIGFDNDNRNSSNQAFQLYGTQTWGRQNFRNYSGNGTWQSFEIPVGNYFTGAINYLTLINDHDRSPRNARSAFRNVRLFERPATAEAPIELGELGAAGEALGRQGMVNSASASDRYQFSLSQTSDVNFILEGLTADANLSLFGPHGELIARANRPGSQTEQLSQTLAPGNYSLEVMAASLNSATSYDLILAATPDNAGQLRDLKVSSATYLGGNGQDEASAVEISPRSELVVAGNFAQPQGGSGTVLLGASPTSPGQILRLSLSGREVLSVTHLGGDINDMDLNRQNGTIVAGGDFGVAVLSATADRVLWSQPVDPALGGAVRRVAIANDGTVVTLQSKTISVWNPDGSLKARTSLVRSHVNDVAIDPVSGAIYVTGFDNKRNALDNNNPVQVAFLTGFDSNLQVNWQSWGFEGNSLTLPVGDRSQNDMADTRGYRVAIGHDGGLYFLGEVAGGNSIFRWNGKDRSTPTQVKYDAYNDPFNSRSPHQAYYARINPQTGEVLQGQLAFPRYQGAANAFRVEQGSITADEAGNIYVGGVTFSGVDDRDNNAIAGQAVGSYAFRPEGDLTALVVSSDFQQRRLWTPFTDNAGKGKVQGFGVGQGRAAILGTVVEGSTITTPSALNPNPFNAETSSLSDVYLATWGTDTAVGFASVQYGTDGADSLVGGATADLLIGGPGADSLRGDAQADYLGRIGGADVFAYNSPGEGGDTILDFEAQDFIRVSAAGFGLSPGIAVELAANSQALGSRAGFVYSDGRLSFDADGAGGQGAVLLASLSGAPSLSASQIQVVV